MKITICHETLESIAYLLCTLYIYINLIYFKRSHVSHAFKQSKLLAESEFDISI